jgi:hypothetical protein
MRNFASFIAFSLAAFSAQNAEAATCTSTYGGCSITCSGGCGCISNSSGTQCSCYCHRTLALDEQNSSIDLTQDLNLCMKGNTLKQVAEYLQQLAPEGDTVVVPFGDENKIVNFNATGKFDILHTA